MRFDRFRSSSRRRAELLPLPTGKLAFELCNIINPTIEEVSVLPHSERQWPCVADYFDNRVMSRPFIEIHL